MTPRDIIQAVAKRRGVTADEVLSKKRNNRLVKARAEIAKILRLNFEMSYPEIGELMMRDHTSIMHLVKKVHVEIGTAIEFPGYGERATPQSIDPKNGFHLVNTAGSLRKWSVLMRERNGVCEIPTCNYGDVLEVHHLISRKMGGGDFKENVIVLCPLHHRALHHGIILLNPKTFPHLVIPKNLCINFEEGPVSVET